MLRLGCVLSALLLANAAMADVFRWIDAAGGAYEDSANWSPFGPPGAADDALFDLDSSYTVSFVGDAECNRFNVVAGFVSLDLGGSTLSAGDAVAVTSDPNGDARLFVSTGVMAVPYVSVDGTGGFAELVTTGPGASIAAGELSQRGSCLGIAEMGSAVSAVNFVTYGGEGGSSGTFVTGEHSAIDVSERWLVSENSYVQIMDGATARAQWLNVWDGNFRLDDPNSQATITGDVSVLALGNGTEARLGVYGGARLETPSLWVAELEPNAVTAVVSIAFGSQLSVSGRLLASNHAAVFVEGAYAEANSIDVYSAQLSVLDPNGAVSADGAISAIGDPNWTSYLTAERRAHITAQSIYARDAGLYAIDAAISAATTVVCETDPNGWSFVHVADGGVISAPEFTLRGAGPRGGVTANLIGADSTLRASVRLALEENTQLYVESGPGILDSPQVDLAGDLIALDEARVTGTLSSSGLVWVAGDETVALDVGGDFWQTTGGRVEFGLHGPTRYGTLRVAGDLHLIGGDMYVYPAGGYEPVAGDVFDLMDFSTAENTGATIYLWPLAPGLEWDDSELFITGELRVVSSGDCLGDLDHDGVVSLVDLTTLLANFGTVGGATPEQGDFDGDGDVDLTDLTTLLSVFGTSCGH